ncbi:MAG: aminoacetone oxidase family FAD-binding enzyme, partial [Clostridia bacterium]|nr:aminoacetone oxidase family FAD-binding enzyme [Clostridia bacterium]
TGVETEQHGTIDAFAVILATGGCSYPRTGSTGDGYRMAEEVGHTVTGIVPSLVPMTSDDRSCADMQGLSLRNVSVSVVEVKTGKTVYSDFGEMLFTHFGVSGPVILSASSHLHGMQNGEYELRIDLKPALSDEQLEARLLRDFEANSNKDFRNALGDLLPKSMIPVFLRKTGVDPYKKVNQITREERREILHTLREFTIPLSGFRPVEEAIVTSGGVQVKEVDPKTMESKLVEGLYFAGEVLDVDAYTGGFNLQIAFSTGRLAGLSV